MHSFQSCDTEKGKKLFEMMRSLAEVEEATLKEGMVKQHNLQSPTMRSSQRDSFYKTIDEPNFIEHLYVGLQLKERVKGLIPTKIIQKLKSL